MVPRPLRVVVLIAALVSLLVPAVQAVPITGELSFGSSVTFSQNAEDFFPPGGGSGTVAIGPPVNGSFAPLAFTSGSILDLNRATSPVGAAINIPNFLTFAAAPNIRFDLTQVVPGVFTAAQLFAPPAAGQTATPVGSHYNLINTSATSSILSFSVTANAVNVSTNEITPYNGIFTAQFSDRSYQSVMATIGENGTVASTFSAHFTPVPEPAAAAAALVLSGVLLPRRRGKRA